VKYYQGMILFEICFGYWRTTDSRRWSRQFERSSGVTMRQDCGYHRRVVLTLDPNNGADLSMFSIGCG